MRRPVRAQVDDALEAGPHPNQVHLPRTLLVHRTRARNCACNRARTHSSHSSHSILLLLLLLLLLQLLPAKQIIHLPAGLVQQHTKEPFAIHAVSVPAPKEPNKEQNQIS